LRLNRRIVAASFSRRRTRNMRNQSPAYRGESGMNQIIQSRR
jgi:hypothetical protein